MKESDKAEPEPKREPEERKPEAESKADISTNLCSSPVEFYSDCDYSNKLEAGKVGVHSLEAENIKGMVVPRGCRVQLFSKSTFSHSFTSKHPSHALVTVGPTRVCLKNKLDPVAYDISHNANVAALVNAIKDQDIKGGRLERHVEELTTSQKSQGAELRRLRSEVDKLKSSK